MPQSDYLLGLNYSRHEVHILCTERILADWERLRGTVPGSSGESAPARRHAAAPKSTLSEEWVLSDEEQRYVRGCLYPEDARMWEELCNATRAA